MSSGEERPTELFGSAGRGLPAAPPATDDADDGRAATARARRMRVLVAAVVVLVAGAGVAAWVLPGASSDTVAGTDAATDGQPDAGPGGGAAGPDLAPGAGPRPDRAGAGAGGSCAVADRALFDILTQVLPETRGATPRPLSGSLYCPSGGRGVQVEVTDVDGNAHGTLRVLFSPPGTLGGGSSVQTGGGSQSTSTVSAPGGGSLSLSSESSHGAAPFDDDLDGLAEAIADRLPR